MEDDEKELLKIGAEAAFQPFAGLIEKLFGGAAEQIGGMWKDKIAVRRQIRQFKLLKKLKAAIDNAGFEPQQIRDNIWTPVLQEASLQDDETLQDRWANLLANAADPRQINSVLPSFSSILREFTSREARFVDALYKQVSSPNWQGARLPDRALTRGDLSTLYVNEGLSRRPRLTNLTYGEIEQGGADLQAELSDFAATIEILVRNRILRESDTPNRIALSDVAADVERGRMPRSLEATTTTRYYFTDLGMQFVKACQSPSPIG
jgi:hypothetical protein